jgi:hypothetical protein
VRQKYKIAIVLMLAGVLLFAMLFKLYAGKSIRFLLDSGLRVPFDAETIEAGNRCVGRDGEWIYIFATDDETIRSYLSRTPWPDCGWQKGPVPDTAVGMTREIAPYVPYLSSEGVWYMHQHSIRPHHDEGRLIIVDIPAQRVYFSFWWW